VHLPEIDLFCWNPLRPARLFGRRLGPLKRRVRNFGDLIGPALVNRIHDELGLGEAVADSRLLSVGSVLHFAKPGDVVWGSGVNGKSDPMVSTADLDVRSVRGFRSVQAIVEMGLPAPTVLGDPALLWPEFWPERHYTRGFGTRSIPVSFVPNLNDRPHYQTHHNVISPIGQPHTVIGQIVRSKVVVATSLHGIVMAEAYGVPARLVRSKAEPIIKYHDYYEGTGRPNFVIAESIDEAVAIGGEAPAVWDKDAMLGAFPSDLWLPGKIA
jgi:pyruvyltransferase